MRHAGVWGIVGLMLGAHCLMVVAASPESKTPAKAAVRGTAAKSAGANPLVGTWKLIAIEERNDKGELVVPLDYGPDPIGVIMYDVAGNMAAQAMRRGRPKLPSDDVHLTPPDLAKTAFTGFNAYFGTYEVDLAAGLVIHHVQGSLIPNWEGLPQRRRFTLTGDKLILEPPEIQAAGQKRTRRLTWQRVAGT